MTFNLEPQVLALGKVKSVNIEWENPKDFITIDRLDIISRLLFIRAIDCDSLKEVTDLYLNVINVTNGFKEASSMGVKRSSQDFDSSFRNLYCSIKAKGFSPEQSVIAINNRNELLNGSHRIAIAAALNLKVPIIRVSTDITHNFSPENLIQLGLNVHDVRTLLWEYYKLKANIRSFLVFGEDRTSLNVLLTELPKNKLVFVDSDRLTYQQALNLNLEMYQHEPWFRLSENPQGLMRGRINEFTRSRIYFANVVVKDLDFDELQAIKEKVRLKIKRGNLPIHTVQSEEENEYLLRCLLHKPSREFLMRRVSGCTWSRHQELNQTLKALQSRSIRVLRRDYVISGSLVLEEMGIRKAADIDVINLNAATIDRPTNLTPDDHTSEVLKAFKVSPSEISFELFYSGKIETFCHMGFLWLAPKAWSQVLRKRLDFKSGVDLFFIKINHKTSIIFGDRHHQVIHTLFIITRNILRVLTPKSLQKKLRSLRNSKISK